MEDKLNFEINGLAFNDTSQYYLQNMAKWAKFLAIIGFVSCGLMVTLGIGVSAFLSTMSNMTNNPSLAAFNPSVLGFVYVAIGAIYFFPSLYLYQFAISGKRAIEEQDAELLATAMGKHHSVYKFMGIFTAIIFGFYALVLVLAILIGGGAALFG
ncbi:hypothetical protein SAMN06298216_3961 [Spirosomataceae bacterium TFI 002]|nr:hypothetical protein SAMN06298216_3961 [Spirosomataceae bacterium TFI 002]